MKIKHTNNVIWKNIQRGNWIGGENEDSCMDTSETTMDSLREFSPTNANGWLSDGLSELAMGEEERWDTDVNTVTSCGRAWNTTIFKQTAT